MLPGLASYDSHKANKTFMKTGCFSQWCYLTRLLGLDTCSATAVMTVLGF